MAKVVDASGLPPRTPAPPPPKGGQAARGPTGGGKQIAADAEHIRSTVGNKRTKGAVGTNKNPKERGVSSNAIGEQGFQADVSVGGEMDKLIKDNLMSRVEGKNPKYSEEIMGHMKEKLFRETQGQTRRARMSLMADAARRGVFRSEATGGLIRDAEIAGIQAYSSGVKDLLIQKAMADHDDMIKAIDSSQQWLANTRQYQLGLEQNEIGRQQIKASLAAAAMSAAASRYAADRGLEGARAGASASRWAAEQAFLDNRALDSKGNYIPDSSGRPRSLAQQNFLENGSMA